MFRTKTLSLFIAVRIFLMLTVLGVDVLVFLSESVTVFKDTGAAAVLSGTVPSSVDFKPLLTRWEEMLLLPLKEMILEMVVGRIIHHD